MKKKIIDSNFERLLADGKYAVLREYFDDFGNDFLMQIFHYEEALIFPEEKFRVNAGQSMVDYWREHVVDEGAQLFELALGIGKTMQADEIAKRIFQCGHDAEAYNSLIDAANRAGKKKKVRELIKQAKANLDKSEHAKIIGVIY